MTNIDFHKKLVLELSKYVDSKYILIGVPKHMNLGDTLIWEAEEELLDEIGQEKLSTHFFGESNFDISDDTIIIWNGGGYFNDVWPWTIEYIKKILAIYGNNKQIFLPNSVCFKDGSKIDELNSILSQRAGEVILCSREINSYINASKLKNITSILLPDVVLGWNIEKYMKKHKISNTESDGILYISRDDREKSTTDDSVINFKNRSDWPTIVNKPKYVKECDANEWERDVKPKLIKDAIQFILPYKTVYSDRMHGAILSWLLNKETVLIDNSYHKSSSLYHTWLEECENINLYNYRDHSIAKILLIHVTTSICNFRCPYCYLSQVLDRTNGAQANMKYTPEQVGAALSPKRLGGPCYFNVCAEGETLLTKDIDKYLLEIVKQGHYGEVVTNLTPTNMVNKILSWDEKYLKHLEFKCSFHYSELKKHNMLDRFVENVHNIWKAGGSANIEMCPSDDLIPYIDEIKEFSLKNFGALPHLTILRNDATQNIELLTKLSKEDYYNTWKDFDSNFWKFKFELFGVKQTEHCSAGRNSIYFSLSNGGAFGCYGRKYIGNILENPDAPIPIDEVGTCHLPHCYNCHALLSLGLINSKYQNVHYGDLRDREKSDGSHWLNQELKDFFNRKVSK